MKPPDEPTSPSAPPAASFSTDQHRAAARGQVAVCAVLSISDSRTRDNDRGGRLLVDGLTGAGHQVRAYELVPDEPARIEAQLRSWLEAGGIELIVTTGGTGISSRDTTIEVVERLLDQRLDGFGELFRMLSWQQVGAAAMLSRALAGLAQETVLFALPGSPNAVRLALEELILPELAHLLWERRR
jgi:molybdenum cofactor biosynthesis protein B